MSDAEFVMDHLVCSTILQYNLNFKVKYTVVIYFGLFKNKVINLFKIQDNT